MKRAIGLYVLIAVVAFGAGYWTGRWQRQYENSINTSQTVSSSVSSPKSVALEVATDTLGVSGSAIPPISEKKALKPEVIESIPDAPPPPPPSTSAPTLEEEIGENDNSKMEPDTQLSPVLAVKDILRTKREMDASLLIKPETNSVSHGDIGSGIFANQDSVIHKISQGDTVAPVPSTKPEQAYPKDTAEYRELTAARQQLGRKLKLWLKDHPVFNDTESPRQSRTVSITQSSQTPVDSERQRSGSRGRRWGVGLCSGVLQSSVAETPLSSGIASELNVQVALSPHFSLIGDVGTGSVTDGQKYSQLGMQLWGIDLGVNYKVMKAGRISSFLETKVGLLHCSPTLMSRERLNPVSMGMLSLGSGFEVDIHANWSLHLTAEYRHAFGSVLSASGSGQDAHTAFMAGFTFYPGGSQDKDEVKLLASKS